MSKARLYWRDGRITVLDDIDPKATRLNITGADGHLHQFKSTDEIDADGCDVYREENGQPPH